jgi:hypothetical protein
VTSQRTAILIDRILSRAGSAIIILVVGVVGLAFTVGVFPRTILGVMLLIAVGGPVCVGVEALMRHAHPVGGLIGALGLIALVWWWCARHAAFMHQNFF